MLTTDKAPALIAGVTATESGTMKIAILKNTVCAGIMARAGDVIDAPEKDANYLIGLGFAETYVPPALDAQAEPEIKKSRSAKNERV